MAPADSRDYVFWYGGTRFYSSARWAQSGIVVPFMRRLHVQAFGYYTNMGQLIEFIIHTNIQPLPAIFFT